MVFPTDIIPGIPRIPKFRIRESEFRIDIFELRYRVSLSIKFSFVKCWCFWARIDHIITEKYLFTSISCFWRTQIKSSINFWNAKKWSLYETSHNHIDSQFLSSEWWVQEVKHPVLVANRLVNTSNSVFFGLKIM